MFFLGSFSDMVLSPQRGAHFCIATTHIMMQQNIIVSIFLVKIGFAEHVFEALGSLLSTNLALAVPGRRGTPISG